MERKERVPQVCGDAIPEGFFRVKVFLVNGGEVTADFPWPPEPEVGRMIEAFTRLDVPRRRSRARDSVWMIRTEEGETLVRQSDVLFGSIRFAEDKKAPNTQKEGVNA